ncbi:MAG: DUF3857 domain-containing protein [Flavobacteriaceae bacterium]
MRLILFFSFIFVFNVYSQKENFQSLMIPSELKEGADAVIRLDEVEVTVNSKRDVRQLQRTVVTVLNQAGNRHVVDHIYHSNSVKVRKAEAIIYDAFGKEIRKLRRRDFRDRSAVTSNDLYSDARYLYIDYTPISYPYTLEISFEISLSNSIYLPNHYFIKGFNVSTEKSSYAINYDPTDFSINYKESLLEEHLVEKTKSDGNLHYLAKSLPAKRYEEYSLPFQNLVPRVQLAPNSFFYEGFSGEATNWSQFGHWFHSNLVAGRDQLPRNTVAEITTLVAGVEDPTEKAKIVYDYVQRNTRYISVQIGIGGYQTIPAAEVDRVKYGDCKGLTNYTKALLETVGVTSYYTIIYGGKTQLGFQEDFPSIEQGNHVILAIPQDDDYKWLECTSQTLPFGFIGDFTDNRNALVLKPDGGELVKTTAYLNEDNHESFSIKGALDDEGHLTASLEISSRGLDYDRKQYLPIYSNTEIDTHYKKRWANIRNLQLNNIQFENDKREVVFKEQVEVSAKNYASKSGDRFIVELNPFSKYTSVPPRYEERTQPIIIKRGFYETTTFDLKLPEGYEIEAIPTVLNTSSPFGDYRVDIQKNEDHSLTFTRHFLLKAGIYPKESYTDFREFLSNTALRDNLKIVLIKK